MEYGPVVQQNHIIEPITPGMLRHTNIIDNMHKIIKSIGNGHIIAIRIFMQNANGHTHVIIKN